MSSAVSKRNRTEYLSKTIAVGLLTAVCFSALAHGAVEPWSLLAVEFIVLLVAVLWAILQIVNNKFEITIPDAALPMAALLAVGLIQSVALADSSGRVLSLSKNVGYTRSAVTVIVILFISFVLVSNCFSARRQMSGLAHFLVIYGLALALFALIQHFTWNGRFYWLRPTEVASPFGPFANHNHFAGYMEMLIPVPIALILTRAVSTELRWLYGFAAIVMGVATITSLSRGGMISLAASMLFLVVASARLAFRNERSRRRGRPLFRLVSQGLAVAAIVGVIGAGVVWIGADPVIRRVTQGQSAGQGREAETFFSSRGWVWRDTISMIRANPFLGVGLGAYDTAFSIYTQSDGTLRVPQAHNDYLQIVADSGIVGGLLALWFLIVVFRAIFRGLRAEDPLLAALALGSGAGLFGILVHSIFDFNLQVPSNALLFLLLTAVSSRIGASAPSSRRDARSGGLEPIERLERAAAVGLVRGEK
jgi:O-antigen ligase